MLFKPGHWTLTAAAAGVRGEAVLAVRVAYKERGAQ
jgi:hypothetical protein